ncbi:hypothetical protein AQUCO_01600380v1 [Aquilegia coerulea]|uniref:Cell differentiation protein rcd1 n=1 Tax=Aquilegia coerulea TaxID=218851 RepID=A0A2G5DRA5_AQUCA|nr:hypothetical protein AQUCO_01600380v1 [Aquilegia coerulea]
MDNSAERLFEEQLLEERTLNLLSNSKIDQDMSELRLQKIGLVKKYKQTWLRSPMLLPETILQLQHHHLREDALHRLSHYLLERREEEPEDYVRTGYLLYNSCCTVTILLQEVLLFSLKLVDGNVDSRSYKRIANVLTLFQCIAANSETRNDFVRSVPSYLIPLIELNPPLPMFENVRAVALSVIGILCQAREPQIIKWAIRSKMIEACRISIEVGSELCKVIGMHILETILLDRSGLSYICSPMRNNILIKLMGTLGRMVAVLAIDQDISPRFLFHIISCYILLCNDERGLPVVMHNLPNDFISGSFYETIKEYPIIGVSLNQLLLAVGVHSMQYMV